MLGFKLRSEASETLHMHKTSDLKLETQGWGSQLREIGSNSRLGSCS